MCGILGVIGSNIPVSQDQFSSALDTLRHRGPDDRSELYEKSVWLGHRRLAIIDLSAAGRQPFVDAESGCVIIYNGEVYNYVEVRNELDKLGHKFHSQSDTEVLLKAYLQWGELCLSKLNGMWSFAVWDPRKNEVFLARDRFGVKPLYIAEVFGCVYFASEPKALLHLAPQLRLINRRALYRFIAHSELYTENRSFYSGIRLLPPAHFARVSCTNPIVSPTRYWALKIGRTNERDPVELLQEFSYLFSDAVNLRLRSDVPVGLSLSGGIDSSAILATVAKVSGKAPDCFTSVYGRFSGGEFGWAKLASSAFNAPLIPVEASQEEWLETMPCLAYHLDAPGYSPAVYPTWRIMQAARQKKVPVMLEGQGADEALGGYAQHAAIYLISLAQHSDHRSVTAEFRKLCKVFPATMLITWLLRELFPSVFRNYQRLSGGASLLRAEAFSQEDRSGHVDTIAIQTIDASTLTSRLYKDYTSAILPGLLHYGDAVSMAHSVESRLPFMDYRLAEWIFSAPDSAKISDGKTKLILKNYLKAVGLKSISQRKDKQGYRTPVVSWLMGDDGKLAKDILLSRESRIGEFVRPELIRKLIERHALGQSIPGDILYKLTSTEFWLRHCIY